MGRGLLAVICKEGEVSSDKLTTPHSLQKRIDLKLTPNITWGGGGGGEGGGERELKSENFILQGL